MKTVKVIEDGKQIELNEKFAPGLEAAKLIEECHDCGKGIYHIRHDHVLISTNAVIKLIEAAAECDNMPAWQD